MELTGKQEKFCIEVASGKSKSEAYRLAYNAEKMKPETINRNAAELSHNNKITTRIKELKKPVVDECRITLEGQILELEDLKTKAKRAGRFNDAINAIKEQNKLLALYEEHNKQKNPLMSDEEKDRRLEALVAKINA